MDSQYILKLTEFHNLQLNLQGHHINFYQGQQFTLGCVRASCKHDVAEGKYQDWVITTYDKLMWITVLAVVFMSASVQQIVNVFVCSIEYRSVPHLTNLLALQSYQFN